MQTELSMLVLKIKSLEKNKFDVDASLLVTQEINRIKVDLKTKQTETATLREEAAAQSKLLSDADKELVKLRAEMDAVYAEMKKKHAIKAATFSEVFNTVAGPPRANTVYPQFVTRMLGEKGIKWLQAAESALQADYKERAYNLMLAAKSSNQKRYKSLYHILELVYMWLKTVRVKARKQVADWLEIVQADLVSGSVKTLTEYRELLQKTVGNKLQSVILHQDEEGAKVKTGNAQPFETKWYEHVYVTLLVARNVIKRAGKSLFSKAKSLFVSKPSKGKEPEKGLDNVESERKSWTNWFTGFFRFKKFTPRFPDREEGDVEETWEPDHTGEWTRVTRKGSKQAFVVDGDPEPHIVAGPSSTQGKV